MKKTWSLLLAFLSTPLFSTAAEKSIDDTINDLMAPGVEFVFHYILYPIPVWPGTSIPFIILWLSFGAIYFTIYMKFINISGFKHAISIIKGKYSTNEDPGEVTHFQALTAALSGTVGLGNIAGVAIAIAIGGPGATFWMILAGLFGMTSKFVECSLAVKYRTINADGSVSGGPMYYLSKGLAEKGKGQLGRTLAVLFSVLCVGGSLGGGNMFQINQATKQFNMITNGGFGSNWIFGVIMAILVGIVIIGGIKSIAKVTEKIVPFMCGIYVIAAIIIILTNFTKIPEAFGAIFSGAFSSTSIAGGFVGVLVQGIKRSVFSNEAGVGSAAIAHSAVKTKHPVTEGFVASLEPFIDTVVVCTLTALVIIITGQYQNFGGGGTDAGVSLTSAAFESVFTWFPYILTLAVCLFAFSTMISWSYYGLKSWTFLFGESKIADYSYKVLFCSFIVIGSAMSMGNVTDFSDAMILGMSFPNIIGLYILGGAVKKDLNIFLRDVVKKE